MFVWILALWATMALSFPLGKMALQWADSPLQLIGLRMTLAGGLILAYLALKKCWRRQVVFTRPRATDLLTFAKVTLFHVYLAFVPEFWALQFLDSLKVNLLFSLTPFVSALLGFFLLGKQLNSKKWLGLAFGSAGMLFILATQNSAEVNFAKILIFSMPEFVLLLGIISACYAWFEIRKLMHQGYNFLTINGFAFLLGGLLCLGQHRVSFGQSATLLPATGALQLFGWIASLILCSNLVGYYLYSRLLHHHSNTFLSFTGFLCPMFGAFYSKLFVRFFPSNFFAEPISLFYLVGFAIIVLGLGIFYAQELIDQSASFF
jgi:drug/metabolite transporter (DMT)-like permease